MSRPGETILEYALDIVPRLRRFGRVMLGNGAEVDLILIQSIRSCRTTLVEAADMKTAAQILFAASINHLEEQARALDAIAIFPQPAAGEIPLLPAVWALPYEERLALALLYVEELEPGAARVLCGTTAKTLLDRAETGVARLLGVLPFPLAPVSPPQLKEIMSDKTPPPSRRDDKPVLKSQIRKLARKMLADDSSDEEIRRALLGERPSAKKNEDKAD